ncbi:MAG: nucleoside 2-deoxyribosyltransferase [Lachnospiraceae bacterium]|nr:nucleoside 2-deoxyribosyltransferase [Lachnospiraceae bacterium]
MNKKIYFAGSIRGGRDDAALYKEIIAHIKETDTVLTEHIGDLSLSALEKGRDKDALIYEQDTAWLRESDAVIAECTSPSLGVGYELAYAEKFNKPCFLFYRKSRCQLSAMLTGNPYYKIFAYETKEEIFEFIDRILTDL